MYRMLIVTFLSLMTSFIQATFLHEPSYITIRPQEYVNHSDFGFAIGYQSSSYNLLVGAPRAGLEGKIYSCDVNKTEFLNEIKCEEDPVNFDSLAGYSNSKELENQHFYLGSSIAATSEFFLTCAPLWTVLQSNQVSDAVGTCFAFDQHHEPKRYKGTYEQYIKQKYTGRQTITNTRSFLGGTGWSTLIDEDDGLLLIIKTSLEGDIIYTPIDKYLSDTKSLVLAKRGKLKFKVEKFYNFGYGVTSGKFFSNKTVYAFSMMTQAMGGIIEFLSYNSKTERLTVLNNEVQNDRFTIKSNSVGTMFGSVLAASDLNMDGLAELLAGAPVLSEEDCVECGAVHIYLGGEMETMEERNRLTLLGAKEFGRFGSAIAARDVDGDNIPELVASAPYEDDGLGAIYIISGYELFYKLELGEYLELQLWELKHTQRIQKKSFRTLGFSLHFIPDVDGNGCSELVAGSPDSDAVVLFKSIQTINVTLSSSLLGNQVVREQDSNFIVQVCATVEYPKPPNVIFGNLTVINSVIGDGTYMPNPKFDVDVSCVECPRIKSFCQNVSVELKDKEPRDYTFKSHATLNTGHIFNSSVFHKTWVVTSPYSQLNKSIEVSRHCSGEDCIPRLSMDLLWSGSKEKFYTLGTTGWETSTIRVRNDGNSSYEACVWVRVSGAPLSRIDCVVYNKGYRCYLPKPLRRDAEHSIKLVLNMTKLTNMDEKLEIEARLFENCNREGSITQTRNATVTYGIDTDQVNVYGIPHNSNITEKDLENGATIISDHEYLIKNNGSIKWKKVIVRISIEKKSFINDFQISVDRRECIESHTEELFNLTCLLDLMPNATRKIIASTTILKSDIKINLLDDKLNTTSEIELYLQPTEVIKKIRVTSEIKFQKELRVGNNKWLIALIAVLIAVCILMVIITILYRYGFFKRKQKQRLHVLRESIKQRNSRRNTHISSVMEEQGLEGLEMDVEDDSPFENIPLPESNKVQVH